MSDKDIAVQKLQDIYVSNGFITSDQIFDVCDELDISIFDTDYVMNKVASLGILVSDTAISADDDSDEKEEVTDYAQVDYNKIYNYFLSNYPAMKQIIDVAKSTPPIQHKEPSQLFIQIRSGNSHAKDILCRLRFGSCGSSHENGCTVLVCQESVGSRTGTSGKEK